jgi:hypothetical protein
MKLATEHLADAAKFDELAALEQNPQVREQLQKQAAAYRKLAENRAKQIGVPLPTSPVGPKEPGVGSST